LDLTRGAQVALLIARNVAIIAWMLSMQLGFFYLERELKSWGSAVQSSDSSPSPKAAKGTSAQRILEYLAKEQRRTRNSSLVVGVCYVTFSLPWFWPYQSVALVFFATLSAVSRPARGLLQTKLIAEKKTGTTMASSRALQQQSLASPAGSHTAASSTVAY